MSTPLNARNSNPQRKPVKTIEKLLVIRETERVYLSDHLRSLMNFATYLYIALFATQMPLAGVIIR